MNIQGKDELGAKKEQYKISKFWKYITHLLWGTKNSSSIDEEQKIDFMHFKAKGRKILANKIENELIHLIKKDFVFNSLTYLFFLFA